MPAKEMLKTMFHSYFVIATGATMAMYLSCVLLYPETTLTPGDIGGVLLLALICDLTFVIFYARRELGKKQMLLRFSLHIPAVISIVLIFAWKWDWVDIGRPAEVAVFVTLILGVYAAVLAMSFFRDKKTADQLNEKLKKRYHSG